MIEIGSELQAAPPGRPARVERSVDPRVRVCLRLLLETRHVGRENAATWGRLREELSGQGLEVNHVRRLQEAASYLRRVEKVAVGGDSQAGIYVVGDEAERRRIAAERVKRIRAEVQELAAFDRALYERIAEAFELGDAA